MQRTQEKGKQRGHTYSLSRNENWYRHHGNQCGDSSKHRNRCNTGSTYITLRLIIKESISYCRNTCLFMFIAAVFTIISKLKYPMEYCSALKIMKSTGKWLCWKQSFWMMKLGPRKKISCFLLSVDASFNFLDTYFSFGILIDVRKLVRSHESVGHSKEVI